MSQLLKTLVGVFSVVSFESKTTCILPLTLRKHQKNRSPNLFFVLYIVIFSSFFSVFSFFSPYSISDDSPVFCFLLLFSISSPSSCVLLFVISFSDKISPSSSCCCCGAPFCFSSSLSPYRLF